MKWAALIVVLAAAIALSAWLRGNPRATSSVLMLMGFLPFTLIPFHLYMAAISWTEWPGYVPGAEFSVLDALALALYLSLPGSRHPLPFRLSMALYFVAVLLSALQAEVPTAALFYPWQLARMFLVYAAVTKACTDPRAVSALMTGMAAGLFMQAGVSIWERFGLGVIQAGGTAGHQNLLGLTSHFVVFPFFALLLSGRRGWLPPAVLLAGLTVEMLTTSRATVGLAVFGYVAVFALSVLRQWTSWKAGILLVGMAMIAAGTPLVLSSFESRFTAERSSLPSDYDERAAFEKAAGMILSDHPLGVGANHYVAVANNRGYNQSAGVAPVAGSGGAHVHNVYWLVAAETGYLGLITFVILLLRPMSAAFLCSWRHRRDARGDLLLGLAVALLTVYIHSFFEWIFISFQAQYMFALDVALVAALAQQLGYWRPRRRQQGVRLGVGTLPIREARNAR